jgi:hypothetical protein
MPRLSRDATEKVNMPETNEKEWFLVPGSQTGTVVGAHIAGEQWDEHLGVGATPAGHRVPA